jgi:hypothetical protein
MCYLKELPPTKGGKSPMNCHVQRVAQSCHVFAFAIRPLAVANLAYVTAPDLAFAPATLNFKCQVGSALPAAQSLHCKS